MTIGFPEMSSFGKKPAKPEVCQDGLLKLPLFGYIRKAAEYIPDLISQVFSANLSEPLFRTAEHLTSFTIFIH